MNPKNFDRVNIRTCINKIYVYDHCLDSICYRIRINRINKTKFLNAGDQLIFKIARYTSLVIILSKILTTPTPLLDIQPNTCTESFTVGIRFLFSTAVRGLRQILCCPS